MIKFSLLWSDFNIMNLARYHGRNPRYILSTDDDFLIRLAGPHQVPWEESTQIQNVSLTGLAFTAEPLLCPLLGEVIKIQFTVPGSRQMACYGIVTRLDQRSRNTMLVGVHFYKLEMAQRIVLAQGLARKFRLQGESSKFTFNRKFIFKSFLKAIAMGACIFGLAEILGKLSHWN